MRITCGGVLIRNNKIMLGLRSREKAYYPNTWDVIGGHCKEGETVEQTLIREFNEELGVTPQLFDLLATYEEPNTKKYGEGKHYFYAIFSWLGEPTNISREHQKIQWFSASEFEKLNLASSKYLDLYRSFL